MPQTLTPAARTAPQIMEGTPAEIAAFLARFNPDTRLMLIIPGVETSIPAEAKPTEETKPHAEMTFSEIFAPADWARRKSVQFAWL